MDFSRKQNVTGNGPQASFQANCVNPLLGANALCPSSIYQGSQVPGYTLLTARARIWSNNWNELWLKQGFELPLLSRSHYSQKSFLVSHLRVVLLLALFLALVTALPRLSSASLQTRQEEAPVSKHKPGSVPGEILVRFRSGANAKTLNAQQLSVAGGRQISMRLERLGNTEIVEGLRLALVAPEDTAKALEALRSRPDVVYAEPNYILQSNAIPNDPRFAEMSNLRNTGQSGFRGGDIAAAQAWDVTTGSDAVVIGVVDTGIDTEHPDLKDNIWRNTAEVPNNGVDDDNDGYIDDVTGWDFYNNDKTVFDDPTIDDHGTHVAGIIGATGNNGVGVVGVSWHVKLMPLKFLGSPDGAGSTSQAIAALQYARMMRDRGVNIRAVNNSWSGRSFSQALLDAIGQLNASGILFVAAAGNDGTDNDSFPIYPANYEVPNVISVGAENSLYERASFSDFGTQTVDIYAPGVDILSTLPGANYANRSGTSMATPHVTGTAALICAARPGISVTQLRNSILFGSFIVSTRSTKLVTYTHLKADGAVRSAIENDTVAPGSVTDFQVSRVGRRLDLKWTASGDDGSQGGKAVLYKISFVDSASAEEIPLISLQPASPGSTQQESVNVPFQHTAGKVKLVPFDNAGNEGPATTLDVSVNSIVANPYVPSESAPSPLSTGGTIPVGLKADDAIFGNLSLPFQFSFFGQQVSAVSVSTNGVLYFGYSPQGNDALSASAGLINYPMIAGLWDDLRTDRRPDDGVYMVKPDADRVIFRWHAVTFDTPLPGGGTRGEHPVSFEIELQRGGNIVIRYGEGNDNVWPVVGISGGERESYFVGSHSSENAFKSLANAPTISFNQPPCSYYSLSSPSLSVSANSSFGAVAVDAGGSCSWTATSNVSWISIAYGANSIGSGNVTFNVFANQSQNPRSGTLTIAGQTFTVNQSGVSCSYQVGTSVQQFPGSGGLSSTLVSTQTGCPWNASAAVSWITINSGASGNGSGGVYFSVAANPDPALRSGTIQIADQAVTINQSGAANPIDSTQTFVTQHYRDFLNREPDAAGLQFWMNNIDNCALNTQCREVKRIDTSAAYFLSIEFQQTGYLVHRFYKASFGRRPLFAEFLVGTQAMGSGVVVNAPGWEQLLQNNKQSFADSWVTQTTFKAIYDRLGNADYVNTLIANSGATFSQTDRDAFITALNSGNKTRAQVVRDIAENQAFYNSEYNAAFVEMQYFGYLRRNPQDAPDQNLDGYNFWLTKLNQFGGDFRKADMVKAFLDSGEYRARFGTP